MWIGAILLASVELVSNGEARLKVETDGSESARRAAALLKRHVVLMTGTALPEKGTGPALRLRRTQAPGYAIRIEVGNVLVEGDDLVRAVYDLLVGWGCRFEGDEPEVPKRQALPVAPLVRTRARDLFVETPDFDPSLPASGVSVAGIAGYGESDFAEVRALGYRVRVASTTFDDFLPAELFEEHPDWFALRQGRREPRGNFALTNESARSAYLDALGRWLEAHPEVDCVGIWPEVTTIWCEESEALGHANAYALLWREAAERFPDRRLEILATGLTLRPPPGTVPGNVEVRLRPGRDASALQGVAGQEVEGVVRAWEARGATVVLLEIDAAPASWCGMPWPCHEAIRADARRFRAAVLKNGAHLHARLWRDPEEDPPVEPALSSLLERARRVSSWGHPRDAADLFTDESFPLAFRIGTTERLLRIALDEEGDAESRRSAGAEAYLGYRALLQALQPEAARTYRRYRRRAFERMVAELLPGGVEHKVGPARVRETLDSVTIETDRLFLRIDRATATVVELRRVSGDKWGQDLCGGDGRFFAVVAIASPTERRDGAVEFSSPEQGRLRIDLSGRLAPGGPRWRSRLDLSSASGIVHQTAEVKAPGGIAAGCRWSGEVFDRWVCPSFVAEGRLLAKEERQTPGYRLASGTLLYCRAGEHGVGLAARPAHRAMVSVRDGTSGALVVTSPGRTIQLDWIFFANLAELGH
jgi:hypothetical protein